MSNYIETIFMDSKPNIINNTNLRKPQKYAHAALLKHFNSDKKSDDALVVLPTGVGKTGLIAIAPYFLSKGRVLVIAPSLLIKDELMKNLNPLSKDNFLIKFGVFDKYSELPSVAEYDGDLHDSSLKNSNIIVLNAQKLQERLHSSLLKRVDKDFFDLIIIDEAHKSAAITWQDTLEYFDKAKVIKVTGTPFRSDGKKIQGELAYHYTLGRAMAKEYIKSLENLVYVPEILQLTIDDNDEKQYTVEEIYDLGLKDSEWVTRSVAYSIDCSKSIVNRSIEKLEEKRKISGLPHKIIAVACSIKHAEQIKELYEEAGKRVSIIHSDLEKSELDQEYKAIENHRVDVAVNVAMLGEGYDHSYLSIAAIFRPFRHELPYIQFIGRILRFINDEEAVAADNIGHIIVHKNLELDNLWEKYKEEIERNKIIRDLLTDENIIYPNFSGNSLNKQKEEEYGNVLEVGNGILESEVYKETELILRAQQKAIKKDEKMIEDLKSRYNVDEATARVMARQVTATAEDLRPDEAYRNTKRAFDDNIHEVVIPDILLAFGVEPKGNELKKLPIFSIRSPYNYILRCTDYNAAYLGMFLNAYLKNKIGKGRNDWEKQDFKNGYKLIDNVIPWLLSMEI